jgi:hypothetical protein
MIAELASEPPNENRLPMDSFKNLQTFKCTDNDPRTVLGWDRMSEFEKFVDQEEWARGCFGY